MKKIILKIIVVLFLTTNTNFILGNEFYFFEKISPDAGFAFDAVYAISEDCNGFVWFGCNNGLYHYNNSDIKKIDLESSVNKTPQSIAIKDILHDKQCNLWVGSVNGIYKRHSDHNDFMKISYFTKDSTYNTNSRIEQIIQFNDSIYLTITMDRAFYFDINEGFLHEIRYTSNITPSATYIYMDNLNNILIGTSDGNVYKSNHPFHSFDFFYSPNTASNVTSICYEKNKYFIGFDGKGVDIIDNIGNIIRTMNNSLKGMYNLPDNRIRSIIRTDEGEIWIGTYQGIKILNNDNSSVITNNIHNGLPQKSIYVLHKGKDGGIWIGTWAGGVAYYHNSIYRFKHIVKVPNEKETKSVISSFLEYKNGNVLIGSEQAGISIFNIEESKFEDTLPSALRLVPKRVKSISKIDNDQMLIGTFFRGAWLYNSQKNTVKRISENTVLDSCIVTTVAGTTDEIWFGPRGAGHSLVCYDLASNKMSYFTLSGVYNDRNQLRVWKLLLDTSYRLWVCTDEGLFYKNKNDSTFIKCFQNDTIYQLDRTMIYTVFEDIRGQIYIGTNGKGLFIMDPSDKKVSKLKTNNLLINADVYGITEDNQENIWFTTDVGVFQYNKKTQETIRHTIEDGLPGNQFIPNSIISTKTDYILFGTSNGFGYIKPDLITTNKVIPEVFLTQFQINNTPYSSISDTKINTKIIGEIKDIELKYNQNTLSFNVASNNFIKSHKNKFKYRLLNYNDEWIEIEKGNTITYTKIPPGKYTLEVHGSNNDNIWSDIPLSIDININYPIWLKWYAFIFYLIIVQLVVYLIIREALTQLKLKKQLIKERYNTEAQEFIYTEKTRFFTNISHEIRTPLTLIMSPLENLLKKFKYDENTTQQLITIKRNSSRLLRLTNQILDYRLLEVNKLKANFQKINIINICNEVIRCFDINIKEKQINLIFSSNYKELIFPADADMIEKIIYNLLSNAIKFSNEKGQIFISIELNNDENKSTNFQAFSGQIVKGKQLQVKVRDVGKGIKKQLIPKIFERFSTDSELNESGTGIGLHLCAEYANLHNGNIAFISEEGVGSTFMLNIPANKLPEIHKNPTIKQISYETTAVSNTDMASNKNSKTVVLLAEDNDELRTYLKNFLQQYYKIVTAKNGHQAFEIAKEIMPNLIITDIIMPHTDGIELVQQLKNMNETSQIPIIILTALSESKYHKETLLKGVESYLTKPIDEYILLAQIENILSRREIMEKHFSSSNNKSSSNIIAEASSLIERAEIIIENNLQNSDFNLSVLLKNLNVSRSTFHRKIKTTLNLSPSEFIRDIRLKYAVKVMKSGNYNVDEVASYVGFNSTSYFIRSFKNKYGKTPKEYYNNYKSSTKTD